jgi:hypothetical protein
MLMDCVEHLMATEAMIFFTETKKLFQMTIIGAIASQIVGGKGYKFKPPSLYFATFQIKIVSI